MRLTQTLWRGATDRTPRYKTTEQTPKQKLSATRYPNKNPEVGHVHETWFNDMHHGSSHDQIPQRIRASESGRACMLKWSLFEVVPLLATGGCSWSIPRKSLTG
jgi:hypothetical protein